MRQGAYQRREWQIRNVAAHERCLRSPIDCIMPANCGVSCPVGRGMCVCTHSVNVDYMSACDFVACSIFWLAQLKCVSYRSDRRGITFVACCFLMLGDPTYWAEQRKKFAVSPTAQSLVCWPGASLHLAGHVRATWQHVGRGLAAWLCKA